MKAETSVEEARPFSYSAEHNRGKSSKSSSSSAPAGGRMRRETYN